ncbi:hypothetical protein B0J13DRAFT_558839 [Dactylonectria estremocensis]|uniref:Uncharacterized protein n=1 Tax=Dactylonectria estremocensis TaxID=1079267 RepID=A0A9P9EMZ5_9HYPO|nr:hypothetical protein B0J13DRAFT_558839 [Dactylonectria estremocensis]
MKRAIAYSVTQTCSRARRFHTTVSPNLSSPPNIAGNESPESSTRNATGNAPHGAKTSTIDTGMPTPQHKKTSTELDEELREKLEMISGEGGGAGVEFEDGKAVGLKRGVKSNMFRVI